MKQRHKIMTAIVSIFFLFNFLSCDKIVDPKEQFKHPREMIWKIGIIETSPEDLQMLPIDLLVISPEDAWLAAWGSPGQIWHYNKEKWTKSKQIGGGISCLAKKDEKDLWAGGYFGKDIEGQFFRYIGLLNYTGTEWNPIDLNNKGDILDMTVDDIGNILACGRDGLVMKYVDSAWLIDTVNILTAFEIEEYFFKSIEYYNGKIFLLATTLEKQTFYDSHYYLIGDLNNFQAQDSVIALKDNIKWGYNGLYASEDNLYSYGSGLWKFNNGSWENLLPIGNQIEGMGSASKNYIIAAGVPNKVFFYDGSSWESISDIFKMNDPTFVFKNVWTNGYETIITGWGTVDGETKLMIWHGK